MLFTHAKHTLLLLPLLLLLAAVPTHTHAQIHALGSTVKSLQVTDFLGIPRVTTLPVYGKPGAMLYKYGGADSGLYVRSQSGTYWNKIGAAGGGGGSYTAGNGIKALGANSLQSGVVRWADTLGNTLLTLGQNNVYGINTWDIYDEVGASDGGSLLYMEPNRVRLQSLPQVGELGAVVEAGKTKLALSYGSNSAGYTALILKDSIWLGETVSASTQDRPYIHKTNNVDKYKVVLMDSATGALVTTSPANVGSGGGGGDNFANADLTATDNRVHSFDGYDLTINGLGFFRLQQPAAAAGYTTLSGATYGSFLEYGWVGGGNQQFSSVFGTTGGMTIQHKRALGGGSQAVTNIRATPLVGAEVETSHGIFFKKFTDNTTSSTTGYSDGVTNTRQFNFLLIDPNSGAVKTIGPAAITPVLTSFQRGVLSSPQAGWMIYCSDCTANDASTGVTQTYNGSTWKNHW